MGGEEVQIVKNAKNVKIYGFDIFWGILNKMKNNLCQEYIKAGLPLLQGKFETITPDFPGKITVFSSFDHTFPPVPP